MVTGAKNLPVTPATQAGAAWVIVLPLPAPLPCTAKIEEKAALVLVLFPLVPGTLLSCLVFPGSRFAESLVPTSKKRVEAHGLDQPWQSLHDVLGFGSR